MKIYNDMQRAAQFILSLPLKPEIRALSSLPIPDTIETNGECLEFVLHNAEKGKKAFKECTE